MSTAKDAMGYLIQDAVEFWPDRRCLQRRDNQQIVILYLPGNDCLLELIRRKPEIVSQNELISAGWGDRKEHVTPNTFYQSMLTLRQALEEIGLGKNVIITVRRRGLMIHERVVITPIITLGAESHDELVDPEQGETVIISPSSESVIKPRLSVSGFIQEKKLYLAYFSALFFPILAGLWLLQPHRENAFSGYKQIQPVDICAVYVKTLSVPKSFYSDFIKRNGLKCSQQRWWYITSLHNSPRISVVRCLHDISTADKNYCSTDFYYGDKYNGD